MAEPSGRDSTSFRYRMLKSMPKDGVVAEIGVWKGDYSAVLLRELEPRQLLLIDPWTYQPDHARRWSGGGIAKSQADMDAIYESVVRRFAAHSNVTIYRSPSATCLRDLVDGSLDMLYIDGDHSYDHVLMDFVLGYHKVRTGGILVGDDWNWEAEDGRRTVRDAVVTFLQTHHVAFLHVQDGQILIRRPRD